MSGEKCTQPPTAQRDAGIQTLILAINPERRDCGNPPKCEAVLLADEMAEAVELTDIITQRGAHECSA